jgi:hypothetical protein
LSGIAALVSSCQDYDPSSEQHVQDVAYTHEFERQFGDIDPDQNWDLYGQLMRRKYAGTRADAYVDQVTITNLGSDSYIHISEDDAEEYAKVLPDQANNLGKVKQDFVGTAHTFTLAPVYWYTGSPQDRHELGIYWYTDDQDNADVRIMGADGELYWLVKKPLIKNKHNLYYVTQPGGTEYAVPVGASNNVQRRSAGHVFNLTWPNTPAYELISHPIQVTVPEEIPYFGFYIDDVTDGWGTRYSESKLNPMLSDGTRPCFTATFNIQQDIDPTYNDNNKQYLCFEDNFDPRETDFDLNDLVFVIEGFNDGAIIDRTTAYEKAVLVCEDLTEYDFDFNDIALGVNYTNELDREFEWNSSTGVYDLKNTTEILKLEVTPMAAGGAFESSVTLNNVPWGEIHTLLNESPAPTDPKKHQIINAAPIYVDRKAQTKTFDKAQLPTPNVGEGTGQYPTYLSQLFATGFFAITTTDGTATKVITSNSFKGKDEGSNAPQMMLLPDYFEWPQERMYIKDAYSGFEEWVQDVTKTDWILTTQVADKITDRGDLKPEVTPETPAEVLETIKLNPKSDTVFVYDATTTFQYGIFLDLSDIQDETYDGASAKLHVYYDYKPNALIWLDDANGNEILRDNYSYGSNIYNTYSISAESFKKALASNGLWIVAQGDPSGYRRIRISKAEIDIQNVTTEAHHKLFVNPTYITFENNTPQTITANSSTGGEISFTSTDNSIVTVSETGVVTPHANGYASILVRAEASTEDGKYYKATSERVSIEVRIGN